MEQRDLDLWRMIDVGWYASSGLVFNGNLTLIESEFQEERRDVQELWDGIKDRYKKISGRFREMNLDLLDDQFPIAILRELRGDVFPNMGLRYGELDSLLIPYISGSSTSMGSIPKKINDCQRLVERMMVLGEEFGQNERYGEYRRTDPERVYL